jgi:mono/diheme cytochrome c family protein
MNKIVSALSPAILVLLLIATAGAAGSFSICGPQGEWLYRKHCVGCHGDPAKLGSANNIVNTMRSPLAVMPKFDKDKISDRGAEEIAAYIQQCALRRELAKKR